ncbi:MAG: hypothetical protein IJ367_01735 [Clostridia bacterium]|nr:hypothetical protein [Clostridia bacterium]
MDFNKNKAVQGMKIVFFCAVSFFLVVLQTTWLPIAEISLPLVFCICLSLKQDDAVALAVSSLCGLMLDLACGRRMGYDGLLFAYISAGCIFLKYRFFCRRWWVKMALVYVIVFVYVFCTVGIRWMWFGIWSAGNLLTCPIYHAAITPVADLLTGRSRQNAH